MVLKRREGITLLQKIAALAICPQDYRVERVRLSKIAVSVA